MEFSHKISQVLSTGSAVRKLRSASVKNCSGMAERTRTPSFLDVQALGDESFANLIATIWDSSGEEDSPVDSSDSDSSDGESTPGA